MSFSIRVSLAALLGVSLTTAVFADDGVRLSRLAGASGYTYQWLASESGVTLTRPGVIIVLHAGYPLYEVNATPVQADRAPEFANGDLVVSSALAKRIRRIAIDHPSSASDASQSGASQGAAEAATGALTIKARPIPGREALALSGTGPANVPVTITLTGTLSKDLPDVVLNRITVMSAADGSYSAVANIGQDTHRGTTIAATATSVVGIASTMARVLVDVPNPSLDSILDQFPPK